MANAEMGRMDARNSCHDVLEAASYKSGGSITINTTSGSNARSGNWGTKPMISPAATNKIGKGKFRLLTMAVRLIRMAMIKTTTLKFSIRNKFIQKPGSLLFDKVYNAVCIKFFMTPGCVLTHLFNRRFFFHLSLTFSVLQDQSHGASPVANLTLLYSLAYFIIEPDHVINKMEMPL